MRRLAAAAPALQQAGRAASGLQIAGHPLCFRRLAVLQMDFSCGLKPTVLTTIATVINVGATRASTQGATIKTSHNHVSTYVGTKVLQQRPSQPMSMLELTERRHQGSTTNTFPNHVSTNVGPMALQQKARYCRDLSIKALLAPPLADAVSI
jgi:hypothetical protein